MAKREKHIEALILRAEERLSLNQIAERLGVSKGSVSLWLRDCPLSEEEKRERMREPNLGNQHGKKSFEEEPSKFYRASEVESLTTSQKGDIAEYAVAFRLAAHGFCIHKPYSSGGVDWLAENPKTGKIFRIEVKWASKAKEGLPFIRLRRSSNGQRYDKDYFDFIVGYYFYSDTAYVYSFSEISKNKTIITISETAAERWDKLK
jgi:transposase